MSLHRLVKRADISLGEMRAFLVDDEPVLVVRTADDEVYAAEDRCSHDDGSFEAGGLSGKVLTCPRHGATFDVATGRALTMPAVAPIETYELRITDDGWIELDMEEDE